MTFSYHRALAPMMWAFLAISLIEIAVVHVLLLLWRPWAAAVVSVASVAGLFWIVALTRSLRRLPVELDSQRLLMRAGTLRSIDIGLSNVAGLRSNWDAASVKAPGVLRLSLLAYPNVLVDLCEPVRSRHGREVRAIAHRLDDPAAFAAALARLGAGHDRSRG